MQQLVDHFQQTSYTPRNFNALLPTPRQPNDTGSSGGAYAYGYNGITHTLTLCSPRGELSHTNRAPTNTNYSFDPKCFERDFVISHIGKTENDIREECSLADNPDVRSDALQSYLDAPINAAVNVALKCATREASFEEVLSWLGEAPDLYACSPKATATSSINTPVVREEMPPPMNRKASPGGGMLLPSHLRPPLIVTVGVNQDPNTSRPPSGSATNSSTTSSEDHKMVVELLSNLKTSPKWVQDLTAPPSTLFDDSPMRKPSGRVKRKMFDDSNTPMNGFSDEIGNSHRALKRVRLELALIEMESKEKKAEDGKGDVDVDADNSIVPFQLLPFFTYLDDHAQRCVLSCIFIYRYLS